MPHEVSASTLQALILCGPGVSLAPLTSNPEEFPKALVPIANRPMVWYPLKWCHRAGVTHVTLITHSSSAAAIRSALAADPHLMSVHQPRVISPKDLTNNSGTAEILRMPEIVSAVTGDFVVLPCDFVTDVDGTSLVQRFLAQETKYGLRGGMGLWYQAKGSAELKGEEADFVAVAKKTRTSIHDEDVMEHMQYGQAVLSLPGDALNDTLEQEEGFRIRRSLLRTHSSVRLLRSYRDAHVYFFPHWILDLINRNTKMDSLGEDVIGQWAKASWQPRLAEKLGFPEISQTQTSEIDKELDELLADLTTDLYSKPVDVSVPITAPQLSAALQSVPDVKKIIMRRVDTPALLLSVSLQIAKIPTLDEPNNSSPPNSLAHNTRLVTPKLIHPRAKVTKSDVLAGAQAEVPEKSSITDSVIGPGVIIGPNCRIASCVVMERSNIGPGCLLDHTAIGRRCNVGPNCRLTRCVVQDRFNVPPDTVASDEVLESGHEGDLELGEV